MARKDFDDPDRWDLLVRLSHYDADALSNLLKVSRRHLERRTKAKFGSTPQKWLDEQRLNRASMMLRAGVLPKIVAGDLGFRQLSHFSRKFKSQYGISPQAFVRLNLSA